VQGLWKDMDEVMDARKRMGSVGGRMVLHGATPCNTVQHSASMIRIAQPGIRGHGSKTVNKHVIDVGCCPTLR